MKKQAAAVLQTVMHVATPPASDCLALALPGIDN
jgi:hypothetical protein